MPYFVLSADTMQPAVKNLQRFQNSLIDLNLVLNASETKLMLFFNSNKH